MVWAAVCTTINKFADVGPELLIGATVDVIVQGDRSFVARLFGVEDRFSQSKLPKKSAMSTSRAWV